MVDRKKILIVDDGANNQLLIGTILNKSFNEFDTIFASSGYECLFLAQKEKPEMIILDVFMPEMDGFETCRKLKVNSETSSIPVLMVTAGGKDLNIRIEGLDSGADAMLAKPFEISEFVALTKVILRIKKTEDDFKKQHEDLERIISQKENAEKELNDSFLQIREYQVKLKKLNTDLIISEECERRRVAEFLHDGICQNLSIINLILTSLPITELPLKVQKSISESVNLLNVTISDTRLLTYDLSPPVLYQLGLLPAIKWKLSQIEENFNIETKLECNFKLPLLNQDKIVLIYRIILELFNNIIKHAHASLISVIFSRYHKNLYISVIDNGSGFNEKGDNNRVSLNGLGLFQIRERLDSIEGSLTIEAPEESGAKIIIQVPI